MQHEKDSRHVGLDIAKGIGICLVVIYHCAEGILNSFPDNNADIQWLANFFRSWLMPMFFIVSGILVRRSLLTDSMTKHRHKLLDWIYLYLVWSIIIYLVRLFSNSFTNTQMHSSEILYILWDPVPTIWFVYALLLSFALTLLLRKQSAVWVIGFAACANLLNGAFFGWFQGSIFQQFCWVYVFYASGFYFAEAILAMIRSRTLIRHWCISFVILSIGVAIFKSSVPFYISPLISFVMAFGYLNMCFWLSQYSLKSKWISGAAFLGGISLFIYLTHFPLPAASRMLLTQLGIYSYALNILLAVILAVFIGYLAYRFSKLKPISYLFMRPQFRSTVIGSHISETK